MTFLMINPKYRNYVLDSLIKMTWISLNPNSNNLTPNQKINRIQTNQKKKMNKKHQLNRIKILKMMFNQNKILK